MFGWLLPQSRCARFAAVAGVSVLSISCRRADQPANEPEASHQSEEAFLCRRDGSLRERLRDEARANPRNHVERKAIHIEAPKPPRPWPQGTNQLLIGCVITREGRTQDCCMMRGVDGLNKAALAAVARWTYEPIDRDVFYVIPMTLVF